MKYNNKYIQRHSARAYITQIDFVHHLFCTFVRLRHLIIVTIVYVTDIHILRLSASDSIRIHELTAPSPAFLHPYPHVNKCRFG